MRTIFFCMWRLSYPRSASLPKPTERLASSIKLFFDSFFNGKRLVAFWGGRNFLVNNAPPKNCQRESHVVPTYVQNKASLLLAHDELGAGRKERPISHYCFLVCHGASSQRNFLGRGREKRGSSKFLLPPKLSLLSCRCPETVLGARGVVVSVP